MAISDLVNQTALRLANGDQQGANQIAQTIRGGNFEDISSLSDYLGIPAESLAALNIGRPLNETEFIAPKTDAQIQSDVESRAGGLTQRLGDIYQKIFQQGISDIGQQYNPIRQRAISEERALGRLRSPVSIPALASIDESQGNAIGQLTGKLASSRAGDEVSIANTIENILQNQRQATEGKRQFNKTFGQNKLNSNRNYTLNREQFDLEKGLGERALYEQQQAAMRDAEARKPGILDYLDTSFKGLNSLSNVIQSTKPDTSSAAGLIALGESNESFCSLVAIRNILNELGVKVKMSKIFKVIEDLGFRQIDYGYLTTKQIKIVLEKFKKKVHIKNGAMDFKNNCIAVIHCSELYGIKNENWHHAVVVTPGMKMRDGYEVNLIAEYPNGEKYVENAIKFNWEKWAGLHFIVS